jgi:hypothetical protein
VQRALGFFSTSCGRCLACGHHSRQEGATRTVAVRVAVMLLPKESAAECPNRRRASDERRGSRLCRFERAVGGKERKPRSDKGKEQEGRKEAVKIAPR